MEATSNEQLEIVLKHLFTQVAGVEQATAATLDILVENGVISRGVLIKGLVEKRAQLDPKSYLGMFDLLIEKLSPRTENGRH